MLLRTLSALLLLAAVVPGAVAQDLLIPAAGVKSAKPDPLKLLAASTKYLQGLEQFSANLVGTVHIVAGEEEQNQQEVYEIKLSKPNRYSMAMVKPMPVFAVRSDGARTMTHISQIGRYALTNDKAGISDFAGSRIAKMIGNGFAGLVFSLLDTESSEEVIKATTASTYVGAEKIGKQAVHHCRFTTGDSKWDAWITVGDAPTVLRIVPDLKDFAAKTPAAQQFDNFKFEMSFEYKDIDVKTAIPTSAFALNEPAGAELVDDLFAPAPEPPHELLGKRAPMFESLDLAGKPIDLGAMVGKKVIILDFWATWCGPCVAALPKINKVANDYAKKGVVFYAVNQQEEAGKVAEFLDTQKLDVPVAMDPDSDAGNKYKVEGLPTSVIIGLDGKVQVVHVGFSPDLDEKLRKELDALLARKDLAAEEIAEWQAREAKRKARSAAAEKAAEQAPKGGE